MGRKKESVIGQVDTHLSSSASRPHLPCPTSPASSLRPGQHSPGGVGAAHKPCLVAHTVEEPIGPVNPNCHLSDGDTEVQGGGATVLRLHSQLSLELSCPHCITLFCLPAHPTSTSHSGAHPSRSGAWQELGGVHLQMGKLQSLESDRPAFSSWPCSSNSMVLGKLLEPSSLFYEMGVRVVQSCVENTAKTYKRA